MATVERKEVVVETDYVLTLSEEEALIVQALVAHTAKCKEAYAIGSALDEAGLDYFSKIRVVDGDSEDAYLFIESK